MTDGEDDAVSCARAQRQGIFSTTSWTVVLAARGDDDLARNALETLCRTYWFPVYALVRRQGHDAEAARDLTQEFFARILSRDGFHQAQRARGRFRSFLSQSVRNFLADEWDRSTAQKRGGGRTALSLDAMEAEERFQHASNDASPDVLFDRQWAVDLLASAQRKLDEELHAAGKQQFLGVFERMAGPNAEGLAEEASRLDMPVNTMKSHLRRIRLRHGAIIRELVAETVGSAGEVDEELRHLLEAIR